MRVLIVEDEAPVRQLLEIMLRDAVQVVTVPSVDEALAHVGSQTWDLIIADFKMPGQTGLDLIDHLARQGNTTPLLMITGQSSRDSLLDEARPRIRRILAKPFTAQELKTAIAEVLPASQG